MKHLKSKTSSPCLSMGLLFIVISANSFHTLNGLSLAGDRGEQNHQRLALLESDNSALNWTSNSDTNEKRLFVEKYLQVSNYVTTWNQTVQHKFLISFHWLLRSAFFFFLPSSSPHSTILCLSHRNHYHTTSRCVYEKKVKHKIWVKLIWFFTFYFIVASRNESYTRDLTGWVPKHAGQSLIGSRSFGSLSASQVENVLKRRRKLESKKCLESPLLIAVSDYFSFFLPRHRGAVSSVFSLAVLFSGRLPQWLNLPALKTFIVWNLLSRAQNLCLGVCFVERSNRNFCVNLHAFILHNEAEKSARFFTFANC